MHESTPPSDKSPRDWFQWDFGIVLFVILVALLLLWMTSELWLPHWGPE